MKNDSVQYANLLSRILLKKRFENQFVVPENPPKALENFLKWYERVLMRIDISDIKIDRPIFYGYIAADRRVNAAKLVMYPSFDCLYY